MYIVVYFMYMYIYMYIHTYFEKVGSGEGVCIWSNVHI